MAPRAPSNPRQSARHEPLFDIHPGIGASIEVFYADRALETSAGAVLVGIGGFAGPASLQTARVPAHLLRAMQHIATPWGPLLGTGSGHVHISQTKSEG